MYEFEVSFKVYISPLAGDPEECQKVITEAIRTNCWLLQSPVKVVPVNSSKEESKS